MSACTWFLVAVGLSLGAWMCAHVGMLGLLLWCWRLSQSSSTKRDFMHIHAHGPGPVCAKKRTTPSPRPSIRGKEIARWGCPECPFTTRHPSACTEGDLEPAPEPLVATSTSTETERDADREWEFLV